MLGLDFHYYDQGTGLQLSTMGDKKNLHDEGIIRKK